MITEINICEIIVIDTKYNDNGKVVKINRTAGKLIKRKKVNKA